MSLEKGHLDEICAWFAAGAGQGEPATVIETHAARVFLIGDHAYKIKKAVDFGYLDFSTPSKRAAALANELERNQAGAPGIYLAVHRVTRGPGGELTLDGPGEVLETVLKMRRFDPAAVLAIRPQWVNGDFAEALGRRIALFHSDAPRRPEGGGAASLRFVLDSNAAHLRTLPDLAGDLAERVIAAADLALEAAAPLLDARRAAGFARRCHGDLHLGNILAEAGEAVLFDCIEFNDALADIDVLYDLAFLVMDLIFRDQRAGAVRVLSGYLDEAARVDGDPVLDGLAALPLFASVRAVVRAHVSAQMGQAQNARAYLQAGLDHLSPGPAALIAIGGLSGSGKSSVARALAPGLGAEPGAIILRSDEIRKRLWGVGPKDRLPPDAYGPQGSERVYRVMIDEARRLLAAGRTVILDAVFLRRAERDAARALAAASAVSFIGAWLEAPAEVLRARVRVRAGDASDADERVVDEQVRLATGVIDWLSVDAVQTPAASAAQIRLRAAPSGIRSPG